LERYPQILDSARKQYLEGRGDRELEVIPVLVYIVPGNSRIAQDQAKAGLKECTRLSIRGPLVMAWNVVAEWMWEGIIVCGKSMAEVIDGVLEAYIRGQISPSDPQAADLLRSLRSAIGIDFRFHFEEDLASGRFPDVVAYLQSLGDQQRSLYTQFVGIIKERIGTHNPMVPRTIHTVIGILRRDKARGAFNTLCRIRTTDSYVKGEPVDCFQIELPAEDFKPRRKKLQAILRTLKTQVELSGFDPVLYHENGKNAEEALLLSFGTGPRDTKTIKDDLAQLVDFLEKVFDETH
jgi:hypothetical protein